ncbi:hypothetical protein KSP39_PZI022557 [Platanthera zijinensis]|uniref:Condensin complex subunit 1 n=1 Tax=Platanthera zijinensis TaxID=2320716 RepID=A0AAP0AVF0_9ASPA
MAPPFIFPSNLEDLEEESDDPRLSVVSPIDVTSLRPSELDELVKGASHYRLLIHFGGRRRCFRSLRQRSLLYRGPGRIRPSLLRRERLLHSLPSSKYNLAETIRSNLAVLLPNVDSLSRAPQESPPGGVRIPLNDRIAAHRNALKIYAYFLVTIILAEESKQDTAINSKGAAQSSKKMPTSVWNFVAIRSRIINLIANSLEINLALLFGPGDTDVSYLSFISNLFENQALLKDTGTKDGLGRIIGCITAKHKRTAESCASILHLIYRFDFAVPHLAEVIAAAVNKYGDGSLAIALVREIGRTDPKDYVRDGLGAENVGRLIVELADRMPRLISTNIGVLIPHFGGESYKIRNALVGVLGKLVVKAFNDLEKDQSSKIMRLRGKQAMLDILIERCKDVSAYTRSRVLQVWAELCEERAVSIGLWNELASVASGRLEDKSAMAVSGDGDVLNEESIVQPEESTSDSLISSSQDQMQENTSVPDIGNLEQIKALVFSQDKSIYEAVENAFVSIYIRKIPSETALNLLNLAINSSIGDLAAVECLICSLMSKGEISQSTFKILDSRLTYIALQISALWDYFSFNISGVVASQSRGALSILCMAAKSSPGILSSHLQDIIDIGFGRWAKVEPLLARTACVALERLTEDDKEKLRFNGSKIFGVLQSLVTGFLLPERIWYAAADKAISTLYSIHPAPETFAADLLGRFLFVVSQIALNQLVYVESCVRKIRLEKSKKEKAKYESEVTDGDPVCAAEVQGINAELGIGASDDVIIDSLYEKAEKEIVCSSSSDRNLIGYCAPFLSKLCKNINLIQKHPDLQASAMLALCRLMIIDADFCEANLQLLFTVVESAPSETVRSNCTVALGDLTVRFPNLMEPWTENMYARLRDPSTSVRKNAVLVLSHLILNDMMKVKGYIDEMAVRIEDKDERISSLAKLFFHELSKKGVSKCLDYKSILFCCALLVDETEETFHWLFHQWLKLANLFTSYALERFAAEFYIKNMFKHFQQEFKQSLECWYEEINTIGTITTFRVGLSCEDAINWSTVIYDDDNTKVIYECAKFETDGFLCKHILHIMIAKKHLQSIPNLYLLKRWSISARSKSNTEISVESSDIVTPMMKWNISLMSNIFLKTQYSTLPVGNSLPIQGWMFSTNFE